MTELFGPEFLERGGLVVILIGLGSLVALTVFLLRLFTLRRSKVLPRKLTVQVRDLVVREQLPDALTLCRMDDSPLARVYLAGLRQAGKPRAEIKEFLLEVGRHEAARMNAGLGVLETVAVVSPLLGLLGTVWGMILAFDVVAQKGALGDTKLLANGIATALLTTMAGLSVAIPSYIFYHYFRSKSDRMIVEIEETASHVVAALKGTPILIDYLEAFRARNDVDLKLVLTGSGDFPLPPALVDHIIDVGFVSATEKLEAMAGALAFCHPSVNESLGIVLLEAWLAGTPGIVHAKGEVLRYQCESSNGGLWFKTYPEFEEAVLLLLNNPDARRALGQAGREYVLREYAWETVEQRMLEALEGACPVITDH